MKNSKKPSSQPGQQVAASKGITEKQSIETEAFDAFFKAAHRIADIQWTIIDLMTKYLPTVIKPFDDQGHPTREAIELMLKISKDAMADHLRPNPTEWFNLDVFCYRDARGTPRLWRKLKRQLKLK